MTRVFADSYFFFALLQPATALHLILRLTYRSPSR